MLSTELPDQTTSFPNLSYNNSEYRNSETCSVLLNVMCSMNQNCTCIIKLIIERRIRLNNNNIQVHYKY